LLDPKSDQLNLEQHYQTNKSEILNSPFPLSSADKENWFHHSKLGLETILKPEHPAMDQIASSLAMREPYSAIAAPILNEGKIYGVLTIHTNSFGRYGTESRKICSTFADYIAYAIDKERLRQVEELRRQTEQELNLARRIQQTFLPETLPQIPGYDLAVEWKTARQVGGDFYDVIQLDEQRYGLLIADVSDKGLPASLYMTVARTLLRAVARDFSSPAEALTRVNQLLQLDSTQSFFVTLFYMILDVKSGQLLYSIAGHTPPIFLQPKQNKAINLERGGIALGIMDPIQLKDELIQLEKGEALFLYTDGVSETRNNQDEEYGARRLKKLLEEAKQQSAQAFIDLVLKDLEEYSGFSTLEDDCTMLVLKRE
jgi:sigma-B regulation protein RsbU (phosphoserine phosphatase)